MSRRAEWLCRWDLLTTGVTYTLACRLRFLDASKSEDATRVAPRSDRPIPRAVPQKTIEGAISRSKHRRCVHLVDRPESVDGHASIPFIQMKPLAKHRGIVPIQCPHRIVLQPVQRVGVATRNQSVFKASFFECAQDAEQFVAVHTLAYHRPAIH